jgi:hypothetical protein
MSLTPQFGTIVPSQRQELLNSNFLKFNDGGAGNTDTFAQQYLPEVYEQEVERYGNRTLSGFLRMLEQFLLLRLVLHKLLLLTLFL